MNKRKWLLIGLFTVALLLAALLALVMNQRQDAARQDCDTCESQTEPIKPVEDLKQLTIGFVRRELPPGEQRSSFDEESMRQHLGEQMSQTLGIPVQWLQVRDGDSLITALQEKHADIGLFHPFEILQSDAIPLLQTVEDKQTARRTEFIVSANSPLTSLDDLLNRPQLRWAFDSRISDYGFLFPASQLMKQSGKEELPPFQLIETKHFDSAITAVLDGKADFATVREGGREIMLGSHPYLLERTRVLAKTDPLPVEVLGMRPAIRENWREQVKTAFLTLSRDESARLYLRSVLGCSEFTELVPEQYSSAQAIVKRIPFLLK